MYAKRDLHRNECIAYLIMINQNVYVLDERY